MHPPLAAGLSFKPAHIDDALCCTSPGLWFEVHPENYMADGGPRLAMLEALADRHPLSLHGVSLSLAAAAPPDPGHLRRLRRLVDRVEPALVSEHLAWSAWGGRYLPDLLPVPRTQEALACVAANVLRSQDALGRRISIENPAHYLVLDGHDWSETDFLAELVRRTGCGLLLDVNNVHVSAYNIGVDALAYLEAFPLHAVTEIHLAGHGVDEDFPANLLVDSHGAPVDDSVWDLYRHVLSRGGPRPTLIERDGNLPSFGVLLQECAMAGELLDVEGRAA
ncbi:MNIO family bufferin maturase [Luteibacter yeojuensis]